MLEVNTEFSGFFLSPNHSWILSITYQSLSHSTWKNIFDEVWIARNFELGIWKTWNDNSDWEMKTHWDLHMSQSENRKRDNPVFKNIKGSQSSYSNVECELDQKTIWSPETKTGSISSKLSKIKPDSDENCEPLTVTFYWKTMFL